MTLFSSVVGLFVVVFRFSPVIASSVTSSAVSRRRSLDERASPDFSSDLVSIIIPARNEEMTLPILLDSLLRLNLKRESFEVVLVDDESTDRTRAIAECFAAEHADLSIQIVSGLPRPEGWTGKNWACHQGYRHSTGKFLLFTDADTQHLPGSLAFALSRMEEKNLDLLTATPVHRCETWWEKILGPFQLFLLLSTAAFSKPRIGRVFAIGQYLLFRRESYERQGGHYAIHASLCDDLELARHCLERGGRYFVEGGVPLFRVRMYSDFEDFLNGWRRIFRLGFRHASISSCIEMYFVIAVLTANMKFFWASDVVLALMLAATAVFAFVQLRFGNFSILGIFLLPLNIALFVLISALALFDLVGQREYSWRGRSYQRTAD